MSSKKQPSFLKRNDLLLRIYLLFVIMIILVASFLGFLFTYIYRNMYMSAYNNTLVNQGQNVVNRVKEYSAAGTPNKFMNYIDGIEEYSQADQNEVWIFSNPSAEAPLSSDFTNAELDETITDEMDEVLDKAFTGETADSSNFDDVYKMTVLRVALPITDDDSNVIGAVMMVSMLDKKALGMKEGFYIIASSIGIALIILIPLAILLLRHISKPLDNIGNSINRMAEGDYSPVQSSASSYQIQNLEAKLSYLAKKLEEIKEEQENLEKQRVDFFANVSHELRTPITVIKGYAETLNDGVVTDPETVRDYHNRMLSECENINILVSDLFTLSKMKNPDFLMDKEIVSLLQILEDVKREASIIAKDKNIEIKLILDGVKDEEVNEDLAVNYLINGDYKRLRQLFMIICDNAVKFSNENSEIDLILSRDEENELLTVGIKDYGTGISDEELPNIFRKFYTSKLRQNKKGTGLGLMIARNIAERHDSEIKVLSKLGEGSEFRFTFKAEKVET